jgi:hypothetical protein
MEPVCKPMASRWQMPFASSRGYSSLKLQHDVAEMLKHRYAQTGQEAVIYFVSDLDPSGLDLQRAWEQAMADFGIWHCVFGRIALTREQVRDNVDVHGRPLDRLAIAVKPSDSRSKRYIADYGRRCWEVDVLPATIIEQAIDEDVRSRLDGNASFNSNSNSPPRLMARASLNDGRPVSFVFPRPGPAPRLMARALIR